jgi:hypothetical protein
VDGHVPRGRRARRRPGIAARLRADQVESANVVGYVTRGFDSQAGEFMVNIGVPFLNVSTADGSYSVLDKLFSHTCQAGDLVYVFDPVSWDLASYSYNGGGAGWAFSGADGSFETVDGFEISVGADLFFMPADGVSALAVAGEVAPAGTQSVIFDPSDGNFMWPIVNPFPVDTTLGNLESFVQAGDLVYVFDPMLWDLASYSYNGGGAGWAFSGADGSFETITDTSTVILPAGTGGFFMPGDGTSRTWNVTLNY